MRCRAKKSKKLGCEAWAASRTKYARKKKKIIETYCSPPARAVLHDAAVGVSDHMSPLSCKLCRLVESIFRQTLKHGDDLARLVFFIFTPS